MGMRAFLLKTTAMITERGLGDVISLHSLPTDATFDAWRVAHPNPNYHGDLDESTDAEAMAAYIKWLHNRRVASTKVYGLLLSIPGVATNLRVINMVADEERFSVEQDGRALFYALAAQASWQTPRRIALVNQQLALISRAAHDVSGEGVVSLLGPISSITVERFSSFLESYWHLWSTSHGKRAPPRDYITTVLSILRQIPAARMNAELIQRSITEGSDIPGHREETPLRCIAYLPATLCP